MGTGNSTDAVKLNETQTMDEVQQVLAFCRAGWLFRQRMAIKKQGPRRPVIKPL